MGEKVAYEQRLEAARGEAAPAAKTASDKCLQQESPILTE